MDGSTSEIEELSKMAERKLSIRSSNDPRLAGGLQLHNPSSFSSSSSSALVNVLQRLDQIDLRLKQIEDKRGPATSSSGSHQRCGTCPPNSYQSLKVATINLEKRCRSLAATLEEVQFKGTLMDRVRSLENRILQLSNELDSGSRTSCVLLKATDENEWRQQPAGGKHDPSYFQPSNQGAGKQGVDLYARFHQSPEPKSREKGQKNVSRHRNETKKADRNWPYRRWFSLGC
ncbi:hypothetical protein EJ110_NYTH45233 [Nymphaea thermarum]|nr:hypothetical protein EJ110_NYTH45233 [Nymphaea thermarum]